MQPFEIQVKNYIISLIYGQPGIGKTTAALSAPDTVLFDLDKGIERVDPRYWGNSVRPTDFEKLNEDIGSPDLYQFRTFAFDTVGKLLDMMGAHLIKKNPKIGQRDGSLTIKGYGARKELFKTFLYRITSMGKNIVFIAHEDEKTKGEDIVMRPEVGGSSTKDIIKEMDLVGYMEANGTKRVISFTPSNKFYAKNSCQLDDTIHVPVLNGEPNVFLTGIFAKIIEAKGKKRELTENYTTVIEEIKGQCKFIDSAKTANQFVEWLKTKAVHVWDSKDVAKKEMRLKVKELELVFNKELGEFEDKIDENLVEQSSTVESGEPQNPETSLEETEKLSAQVNGEKEADPEIEQAPPAKESKQASNKTKTAKAKTKKEDKSAK